MMKKQRYVGPFFGLVGFGLVGILSIASLFNTRLVQAEEGVSLVHVLNYPKCIELKNATTRVVLGHHTGGRVLIYEQNGKNVLYLSPKEADWDSSYKSPAKEISAGRLDIGPELVSQRGPTLWSGRWTAEVTGPRSARLTSAIDPKSGLRITRDFALDANSSKLSITQTVENAGKATARQGFWCRAFAHHGGIAVVPITPAQSRYPKYYTMGEDLARVNQKPEDPMVRRDGDFLIVDGPPAFPKLGFDSMAGWLAYQTRENQLIVMRYPTFPDRVYAEVTGMTLSVWHPLKERVPACELEPIGPMEVLEPGQKASFTVHWWLFEHPFPENGKIDPKIIANIVGKDCL